MDKINFLKNSYNKLPNRVEAHLILPKKGCSEEFMQNLKDIFPRLSNSYLQFLKLYDGINLEWISFRGSPEKRKISIFYLIKMWKEDNNIDLEKKGYCPIGEDAAGNLFCLDDSNQIIMFYIDNPDEPPKFIADSFESFMDECVLGKRYPEMSIEGSPFHQFLKEQGWA
jgi:hypothetical protein